MRRLTPLIFASLLALLVTTGHAQGPQPPRNGRFLGNGGGGSVGGSAAGVNRGVALGFAAGATDTGHDGGNASLARDATGRRNWQAIRDFALTRSRPLCQYPLVAKYKGSGGRDDAANVACSAGL